MDRIHYVRSMPSRIVEMPGTKDLRLRFMNDSFELEERDFDLVVLGVGLDPKATVSETISGLGIELNEFGFCATDRLLPLETSRRGVFVAGVHWQGFACGQVFPCAPESHPRLNKSARATAPTAMPD